MATRQDTLWERFLKPIASWFLDEEEMQHAYEAIDWDGARDRLTRPDLAYPEYYRSKNFHGIEGGYLTRGAAVTYDPITRYALPPSEIWMREDTVGKIAGQPRRILDLGCGTGSTTLLLKEQFPQAEVFGLDLSPYMLAMAESKARDAGLEINWQHGQAEATEYADASFDVVTASLLFHETPAAIAGSILQEAFRLLVPGGQFIAFDGHQKTLRQTQWLRDIFEEPYIDDYAAGNLDAWLGAAGFIAVETEDLWFLHQVSWAWKPLPGEATPTRDRQQSASTSDAFVPA